MRSLMRAIPAFLAGAATMFIIMPADAQPGPNALYLAERCGLDLLIRLEQQLITAFRTRVGNGMRGRRSVYA